MTFLDSSETKNPSVIYVQDSKKQQMERVKILIYEWWLFL